MNRPPKDSQSPERAKDRRAQLSQLKEEFAKGKQLRDEAEQPPTGFGWGDSHRDEDVWSFVEAFVGRKQKRKHQLQIIMDLFEDPIRFGLQTELIPSSTSAQEIEQRRQELQYRIDVLKSLLEMMESEMDLLSRAEAPETNGDYKPET